MKFTDHDHNKYITTPEFNKLTAENLAATLAEANLACKTYIATSVKKKVKKKEKKTNKQILMIN